MASMVSPGRIMEMAWGYAPPLMIEAAVQNRVFDALDGSSKTLPEVAEATGASQRGLRALMDGLVGLGLLVRDGERYGLGEEAAAFLVSGKPGYQGGLFAHVSGQLMPKWLQLSESVKTGKPAAAVNQENVGGPFFAAFVEALFAMNAAAATALAESLSPRLGKPTRVLDVAAGSGVWGIMLARKSPSVTVTAVDWAGVIPVTRRVAQREGVADRVSYIEGDLKTADFGQGYDIATLGHILHSEGERAARKLIQKIDRCLKPGGTIAIAEFCPNDQRTAPPMPLIFACNMLVHTDEGNTFTVSELNGWLADAGFLNVRRLEMPGAAALILADKS